MSPRPRIPNARFVSDRNSADRRYSRPKTAAAAASNKTRKLHQERPLFGPVHPFMLYRRHLRSPAVRGARGVVTLSISAQESFFGTLPSVLRASFMEAASTI